MEESTERVNRKRSEQSSVRDQKPKGDSPLEELPESFKQELKELCDSALFLGKTHEILVSFLPSKPDNSSGTTVSSVSKVISQIKMLKEATPQPEADFTKWFPEAGQEHLMMKNLLMGGGMIFLLLLKDSLTPLGI